MCSFFVAYMIAYHSSNPKLQIINLNLAQEQSFSQNKQAHISKTVNVPIHFQDERLSSKSASRSLVEQSIKTGHNKKMIDQRAAAIFLQQFLDINYNK